MRLGLLASLLALVATPALAQRVDTRRIDIREGPAERFANCGFNAIARLRLQEMGADVTIASATWWAGAPNKGLMTVAFAPAPGHAPEAKVTVASVIVPLPRGARPVRAQMAFDGQNSGDVLQIEPSTPGSYAVNAAPEALAAYVDHLFAAASAEMTLFDRKDAVLARLRFDVRPLRRIPELLNLVEWRCTSPDR